jgi:hypothetical protein
MGTIGPPPGGGGATFSFLVGTQASFAGTLMTQPGCVTKPSSSAV